MTEAPRADVLIVGTGSAGSVLAERLSQNPDCTVRALETGPGPADPGVRALTRDATRLPVGTASPLVNRYTSTLTEQPARQVQLVRGKTVGGSGAVNGGYFCRAVPADFADWDLPGWGWDEVLGHFCAIETDLDQRGAGHGSCGPVQVQRTAEINSSTAQFVQSAAGMGFPWLTDLNSADQFGLPDGVGAVPLNIVDGVRMGPGAAFLEPVLDRPNLHVHSGTRVVRLLFSGTRVSGALAVRPDGQAVTYPADRIVLSAGAIGSAHLLMLSGIGEPDMLRAAGVGVRVAAPVGMASVDHPEWVLPTTWGVQAGRPVLEVVLSTSDGLEIRPYTGGFVAMVGDGPAGHPDWPHVGVALMKPNSRGRLTLTSPDPAVPPRIEHRYDSDPADLAALRSGAQLVKEMLSATTNVGEPIWSTSQHLCRTAPMGAEGDPHAVLDARCRVRGVDGLWVIDGSIMPSIPSRGPHATTVMLAHRAAEFVAGELT